MKIILKRKEEVPEETLIRLVDFIRTFRVLQISKLIKHFPGFQLLVSTNTSNTVAPHILAADGDDAGLGAGAHHLGLLLRHVRGHLRLHSLLRREVPSPSPAQLPADS